MSWGNKKQTCGSCENWKRNFPYAWGTCSAELGKKVIWPGLELEKDCPGYKKTEKKEK